MSRDAAEEIALKCLAWLVQHDELLQVFLGSTGASASDLRMRASEPEFLGSVLDFLLMDDAWVLQFCSAEDMPTDVPIAARAALPGGEMTHWT